MKNVIRITLTLFAVMVIYLLVYWTCFSDGFRRTGNAANFISLSIAILIGIVLWKKMGNISNSLPAYIFGGGILVGTISFILGYFGPIILTPSSNQGPLLGIFVTGPIGFLLGLFLGGLYWNRKVKNKNTIVNSKYPYILAIILGGIIQLVLAVPFIPEIKPFLFGFIYLFGGALFGFLWPKESWRWGIWIVGPMIVLMGLSVLFAGQLEMFLKKDLPILLLAIIAACLGSFLLARFKHSRTIT